MINQAADILGIAEDLMWHGFYVFLRVSAVMMLLPAFGENSVPVRVKLGLAVAFTMVVAAALPDLGIKNPSSFPVLIRHIVTEFLNGALLGIGVRLFVMALQTAGSMAAQATSLAQVFGGAGVEPMPAIGHVLTVAGLALAVLAGLHIRAASLMILSYDMLPVGTFPAPGLVGEWGVAQIAFIFSLAFQLAVPFVIISVLYNLTLGVINRAMPQLMVAFVGAPLITFGGMALLFLLAPLMLQVWLRALNGFFATPFGGL